MALSDLRNSRQFLALSALGGKLSWRHIPLLLVHGIAIGLMFSTEIMPIGMLLFLLTWGFLNFMLIDFATVGFLLTIYPNLPWLVIALLAGLIILTVMLWRFDPHRVSRRIAA